MKQLILGTTSPRRREMFERLGIPYLMKQPCIDERAVVTDDPRNKVEELARLKANSIPLESEHEIILTADTIVAFQGAIFEKPQNKDEAFQMIQTLNGKIHDVYTAVALRSQNKMKVFSVNTEVEFWELKMEEIKAYIDTEEPYDKAGAYGIQGAAQIFIKRINGDYYNVVGLPISYVVRELKQFNFPIDTYVFR